jgi:hypothetical protein
LTSLALIVLTLRLTLTLTLSLYRQERERIEESRRETYLHKPEVKSRALEAIAKAREAIEAENQWMEEKQKKLRDLEAKVNPYGYNLNNLSQLDGKMLPAEHLLMLSSEGKDTKNIIKSEAMNERTVLAYKALKVNEDLTRLAVSKGLIKEKKPKTWYQKEISPFFQKKYISSSEDEEENEEEEEEEIVKKNKVKVVKSKEEEKREKREKEKEAHAFRKRIDAERKNNEREEKDALDAKIVAKLNQHYGRDSM